MVPSSMEGRGKMYTGKRNGRQRGDVLSFALIVGNNKMFGYTQL